MEIGLGNQVAGTDGDLGEVKRLIMDPKSKRAEQMVVKHGLGGERTISIFRVQAREDNKVYVDLDKDAFGQLDRFSERGYRSPGMDPDTTPDWQQELGMRASNLPAQYSGLESSVDASTDAGITPEDERLPIISTDTVIYDRDGKKAGHVGEFVVESETGAPVRLAIKSGGPFSQAVDIPLELVSDYGPEGIVVQGTKDQFN